MWDVIVIGSGPAGTALVSALCDAELRVAWVAPEIGAPWENNYGIWVDELPPGLPDSVFEATWERPLVQVRQSPRRLDRAYGRIDGEALRQKLLAGCDVERVDAAVTDVKTTADGVSLRAGTHELRARVVFDATGRGLFLQDERAEPVAAQTAYGVLGRVDGDPLGGAPMALMDFDDSWRDPGENAPPTFLYAMQLGDLWFLEETVLVARPAHPIGELRNDLDRRLAHRGVEIVERLEEERCFIPMGTELPSLSQRVVGFGASAGYVHPASGYSLARSLNSAAPVARAVADSLATTDDPADWSRAAWEAVWPSERRRARRFFRFGMETLLTMDRAQTATFFETFFELPDPDWQGYLSDQLTPGGVQRVMLRLFGSAEMSLRLSLAAAAMGKQGVALLRAMFGRV